VAIGAPLAATPGNGTASPATVNAPAGRAVNDLLRVSYSQDSTSRTVTTPSGWTLVEGPVTSTTQRGYIYARYADGTSADNFSATISGATNWLCNMLAYPGVDTSGAILTTAIVAHGNNLDASAVTAMTTVSLTTPAVSGCVLVGSFTVDAVSTLRSFTPTSTSPSVGTPVERYDNNEGTGFVASAGYDTVGLTLAQSTAYTMTATCNGSEVGTHYACILAPASSGAFTGSGAVASTSTVTADAVKGLNATATVAATVAITAAGILGVSQPAPLDTTATITAAGTVGGSGFNGTADRAVTVGTTAAGSAGASASVAAAATLTATGATGLSTTATRATTATLTAQGSTGVAQAATETISVSVTAAGTVVAGYSGTGTRTTAVTITADGAVATSAGAPVVGSVALTATGMVASSSTAAVAIGAMITAAGFVSLDGAPLVTPPERTMTVPADIRTISIGAESRATIVPADDRTTGA